MSSLEMDEIVSDFSRFYIMTILFEGSQHGYSIMSKFRKRIGKEVSPSLVYPFLSQLEKTGLARHFSKPVGQKKRKVFELTEDGKDLCKTLFKRFSVLVSAAIEPSLEVCTNCGCKVFRGGYKEAIDEKELTFCCVHCAASYKREASRKTATPLTL